MYLGNKQQYVFFGMKEESKMYAEKNGIKVIPLNRNITCMTGNDIDAVK